MIDSRENSFRTSWLVVVCFIGFILIGLFWGNQVSLIAQAKLYENLFTCSAMLFGVIVVWAVFLYSRTQKQVFDASQVTMCSSLRPALLVSSMILATMLVCAPFSQMAIADPWFEPHESLFLRMSMAVIMLLTGLELYVLGQSIIPFLSIESELSAEANRRQTLDSKLPPEIHEDS